jgi:hypothetical protein
MDRRRIVPLPLFLLPSISTIIFAHFRLQIINKRLGLFRSSREPLA